MAENNLLPVVDVPEVVEEQTVYDMQYKRSMAWDPEFGDFVRSATGKIEEADGKTAYIMWCLKMVQTERYKCLAYSDEIGTEMERALGSDDIETVESQVRRTVTEALLVNPRTEAVVDFTFQWNGDEMHCSVTVKGVEYDDNIIIEF